MENDNLKQMWLNVNNNEGNYHDDNIETILKMKHSKILLKVLHEQKLKVFMYSIFLLTYSLLMIYAFLYLKIRLSLSSVIPLMFCGMYIFYKTTSEFTRYYLMNKTADDVSIKESVDYFKRKLRRISISDLLVNLIFYYMLTAICIIYAYDDIYAINNFLLFIVLIILISLVLPWFLKYLHHKRYSKLYSNINDKDDL
jgi:hypothetical protein